MNTRSLTRIAEEHRFDPEFYAAVRRQTVDGVVAKSVVIPPFSGRGLMVPKGHAFRIVLEEGPQVADVAFWNAQDSTETFNATRTWVLEGWYIEPGTRLWSDVPRLRPMATCTADTVPPDDEGFHHHFVGTHCTPEWLELRSGEVGFNACRVNLLEGIEPFGLSDKDIRDNINVHQKVKIDPDTGRFIGARSEGGPGDYIEFYAEMDLIVSVGLCPNADNTRYWSVPEDNAVKPMRIDVIPTTIDPKEWQPWHDWHQTWKGSWLASRAPAPARTQDASHF